MSFVKQGLYDPAHEHDACGVGFVANIRGERSHELMSDDFLAWGNLGETYLLLPEYKHRAYGLFARAREMAAREMADRPDDQQAIRMRAFYEMRLGNRDAALQSHLHASDVVLAQRRSACPAMRSAPCGVERVHPESRREAYPLFRHHLK